MNSLIKFTNDICDESVVDKYRGLLIRLGRSEKLNQLVWKAKLKLRSAWREPSTRSGLSENVAHRLNSRSAVCVDRHLGSTPKPTRNVVIQIGSLYIISKNLSHHYNSLVEAKICFYSHIFIVWKITISINCDYRLT